jgi:hypothetical protein
MVAPLFCAGVLAAGCSDDDPPTGTTTTNEYGRYTLAGVNNQSLPYTVSSSIAGTMVVRSATLDLTASASGNPTYVANIAGTLNGQSQTILSDMGTYARSGGTLTFSSTTIPGATYVGSVGTGNALAVNVPGLAFGTSGTLVLAFTK